MEIKSRMTSIQPKVTSNDTEISQQVSKQPKLLSDEEIAAARGSQDMFQVVDAESSLEFLIGNASKLETGDNQEKIESLRDSLDELKKSEAEIQEKLVQNTGIDSDDDD